jgi:hypothetical protein
MRGPWQNLHLRWPVSTAQPIETIRRRSVLRVAIDLLGKRNGESLSMKRLVAILLLSASLLTPVVTFAEEHRRYYDRERRDWHEWNEHESRAYRHWLMEERRERRFREYRRLNAQRQRDYWR